MDSALAELGGVADVIAVVGVAAVDDHVAVLEHLGDAPDRLVGDLARVEAALRADPAVTHLAAIYSETSTGVVHPVPALASVAARTGRRMIVDAVSAFGALPLDLVPVFIPDLTAEAVRSASAGATKQGVTTFRSGDEWLATWAKIVRGCKAANALDKLRTARDTNAAHIRLDIKRRDALTATVDSPLLGLVAPTPDTVRDPLPAPSALDLPDVTATDVAPTRPPRKEPSAQPPAPVTQPARVISPVRSRARGLGHT